MLDVIPLEDPKKLQQALYFACLLLEKEDCFAARRARKHAINLYQRMPGLLNPPVQQAGTVIKFERRKA
jgi:hypothetical protein